MDEGKIDENQGSAGDLDGKSVDGAEAASEVLSLDDLDSILEQEDPEFQASLSDINQDLSAEDLEIESIDSGEGAGEEALEEAKPSLLERIPFLAKIKTKNRKVWTWVNVRYQRALAFSFLLYRSSLVFLQTRPRELLRSLISRTKIALSWVTARLSDFRDLPLLKKVGWLAFAIVFGGLTWIGGLSLQGVWVPQIFNPPIKSLKEVSQGEVKLENPSDLVKLYPYFAQEVSQFQFKKLIVNLKPSALSGPNPMGVFEFLVEVDSEGTAVELRSREVELNDRMHSVVRTYSFNELSTNMGKTRLKKSIRSDLNLALTQGWVSEVYLHKIVIKP